MDLEFLGNNKKLPIISLTLIGLSLVLLSVTPGSESLLDSRTLSPEGNLTITSSDLTVNQRQGLDQVIVNATVVNNRKEKVNKPQIILELKQSNSNTVGEYIKSKESMSSGDKWKMTFRVLKKNESFSDYNISIRG
jgi:hypothetical protein